MSRRFNNDRHWVGRAKWLGSGPLTYMGPYDKMQKKKKKKEKKKHTLTQENAFLRERERERRIDLCKEAENFKGRKEKKGKRGMKCKNLRQVPKRPGKKSI